MDDAKADLVRQWVQRAARDLASAQRLVTAEPPLRDAAVYHLHQFAEKALKALLVTRDTTVPKTHDLAQLAGLCIEQPDERLLRALEELNPYATLYRYPGSALEPDDKDCRTAFDSADCVRALLLAALPSSLTAELNVAAESIAGARRRS